MSISNKTLDKIKDNVTENNLRLLYENLVKFKSSKDVILKQQNINKDLISTIINFLVEAEKTNQPAILDLFCELNFIKEFIEIIDLDDQTINLTIIESFSFLFVNLSTSNFSYYILSNNFINLLISKDYSKYDDNFFSYYISFIKSLALRLDQTTIQFFYQTNVNSFPLVECSINLYNFNDPMIRTCVKAILLTILKIKYDPIQDHFVQLPTVEYFIHLTLHLKEMVMNINEYKVSSNQIKWNNVYEDLIDEIRYIKDILRLNLVKINYILINSLFHYLIIPILFKALLHNDLDSNETKDGITKEISLIVLKIFIDIIEEQTFSNLLYFLLYTDSDVSSIIEEVLHLNLIHGTKYFFSNWVNKKQHQKSFFDLISQNYTSGFFMSLVFENNLNYLIYTKNFAQLQLMQDKVKQKIENSIPLTSSITEEMIHEYFSLEDYKAMKDYHESVSNAIGIKVGLLVSQIQELELQTPCFVSILHSVLSENMPIKSKLNTNKSIKYKLFEYIQTSSQLSALYSSILLYSSIKKNILLMIAQEIEWNKINVDVNSSKINFFSFKQYFNYFNYFKKKMNFELIAKLFQESNFSLRLILSELIIMNINNTLQKNENSTILISTEIQSIIDFILNNIYYQTLKQIKDCIQTSHTIRENGYEYFKQQWIIYSTKTFCISSINSFIERSLNLNPHPSVNPNMDYLKILRNKSDDIDTFKYYLIMYMRLCDFRITLLNRKSNQTQLIQNKFPLEANIKELEINQILNLKELNTIDFIQEAWLKLNNTENNLIVAFVYYSFLYFCFKENEKLMVMFKYPLRNVSLQKDGENSINILVINNGKSTELSLIFNTIDLAKEFNWKVLDKKMAIINNEKMLFYMYFQNLDCKNS